MMPRIYACLAVSEILLLLFTAAVGFLRLDVRADRHVLLAILALLLSCLIQTAAFTYLTVLEKMTAQAAHLGRLGLEGVLAIKNAKKHLLRWLAALVLALLFATATGARHWRDGSGGRAHFASALVMIAFHVVVYVRQYSLVCGAARVAGDELRRFEVLRSHAADGGARRTTR